MTKMTWWQKWHDDIMTKMTWWQKWHNDKNDIHGKGNKSDKLTNMTKNHKHYKYRINDIYEMTKMAKIIQKSQKIKYNTEWNVRGNKKMHFIKDSEKQKVYQTQDKSRNCKYVKIYCLTKDKRHMT